MGASRKGRRRNATQGSRPRGGEAQVRSRGENGPYTYEYEDGSPAFQVRRHGDGKRKRFSQHAWDGTRWVAGRQGIRPLLYRLPDVLAAVGRGERVYVTEGEKDAEAAYAAGAVATTNPGGAGSWRDELSGALAGAKVVVVYDRDRAGRRHALQVAASLDGVASRVRFARAKEGTISRTTYRPVTGSATSFAGGPALRPR